MAEQPFDTYFQRFLNRKPTISELFKHVRVGTKWYTFGRLLKLDIAELDIIDELDKACDFKIFRMFELWLKNTTNATRREVIETLQMEAIGKSTVAEEYIKALKIIKEGERYISVSNLALPLLCLEGLIVYIYTKLNLQHYMLWQLKNCKCKVIPNTSNNLFFF